ncbi:dihydroxy-acid/6-phosphogluconate dehydratase [Penicillium paradoxum]|uniref:dihydroxy-acid/6-phosphogluconate dehydratase n=1 Tax=Penicillium paradoxum TaxID=176176 RepID=UPI002548FF5E|nr:dihydroxy-acid/6-phosphogluconate dehydratase [Penicillium paradoxum]KAJ5795341.1 dihydroxy-acid/6-phosphogluconate dehydratase [Penicillium paradoxum]
MPEAGLTLLSRELAAMYQTGRGYLNGRITGTAGGKIVLHVSPMAAVPRSILGIVANGDWITCNGENQAGEMYSTPGQADIERHSDSLYGV